MFDLTREWPPGLESARLTRNVLLLAAAFVLLLALDIPITHLVRALPDATIVPFRYITRLGKSDWFLIPAALIALICLAVSRLTSGARRDAFLRMSAIAAFVLFGTGLPGLAANLVKRLVGRARPVQLDVDGFAVFHPVFNDWHYQSFPSGDTTTIVALGFVVGFLWPRLTWPAMILAALVALSRIMVGMHYPSDVLGGIVFGTLGAYAIRNYCADRGWLFIREGDRVRTKDLAVISAIWRAKA